MEGSRTDFNMQTISQIGDERQRQSNEETHTRGATVPTTHASSQCIGALEVSEAKNNRREVEQDWVGQSTAYGFEPREYRERHVIRGSMISGSGRQRQAAAVMVLDINILAI